MLSIKQEVADIINSKYKVLEIIDMVLFDHQIDLLESLLSKYKNHTFEHDQRILILHHDTDYYISNNVPGFTMYNLFVILNKLRIPQEFLIMLTNHYGIKEEIHMLSTQICNAQPLKIIYTSQWVDFPYAFNTSIEKFPLEVVFCCLNGMNRIHRLLTLCALSKHNILSKGMVSYHFDQ